MSESSFGYYPEPQSLQTPLASPRSTLTAYGVLSVIFIYYILHHLDYTNLPLSELLWNTLVYMTPSKVLAVLDKDFSNAAASDPEDETRSFDPRGHAGKSNAMRRVLGLERSGIMDVVQRTRTFSTLGGIRKGQPTNAPPGLGNWDNSCYQNSVLQGLASLSSLPDFTESLTEKDAASSTVAALKDLTARLNDEGNVGKTFWTPAKLKNMSSWQQQDAQEYFSKVLDEVEKDVKRDLDRKSRILHLRTLPKIGANLKTGLNQVVSSESGRQEAITSDAASKIRNLPEELQSINARNPLEGHLAQRVGCQECGYVEGLTTVPFNCLTVPLGKDWLYDIRACLDDFTALELINGVECAKCTLLQAEKHMVAILEKLNPSIEDGKNDGPSPGETGLGDSIQKRLSLVRTALEDEDFPDQLFKKCQIGPKQRISTTKSRQAVIARAPKALAIHVNRSVFNEHTGVQSKNYADVKFPIRLELDPWCLGRFSSSDRDKDEIEHWNLNPSQSLLSNAENGNPTRGPLYELRAVVTHYGRHENGHYICYRRSPYKPKATEAGAEAGAIDGKPLSSWWRLSDEDVTEVSEENVLSQGGVFMLFYEQIQPPRISKSQVDPVPELVAQVLEEIPETMELKPPQKPAIIPSTMLQSAKDEEEPAQAQTSEASPGPITTDHQEAHKNEAETISPPSPVAKSANTNESRQLPDLPSAAASAIATVTLDSNPEPTVRDSQEVEGSSISESTSSDASTIPSTTESAKMLPTPPSSPILNTRVLESEGEEPHVEKRSLPSTSTISPRTGRRSASRAGSRAMMESVAGVVQAN